LIIGNKSRFDRRNENDHPRNGRGEIYMDSLEMLTFGAGGLLWGYYAQGRVPAPQGL
jgi:hypothetical protein